MELESCLTGVGDDYQHLGIRGLLSLDWSACYRQVLVDIYLNKLQAQYVAHPWRIIQVHIVFSAGAAIKALQDMPKNRNSVCLVRRSSIFILG